MDIKPASAAMLTVVRYANGTNGGCEWKVDLIMMKSVFQPHQECVLGTHAHTAHGEIGMMHSLSLCRMQNTESRASQAGLRLPGVFPSKLYPVCHDIFYIPRYHA